MNDLQVKEIKEGLVSWNYEDLKKSLEGQVEKYTNLAVTEETLKDCQVVQKELSGLRRELDDKRKEVKRIIEKPIKEFDDKCKELIAVITKVEDPIKSGIQVFEDERRKEQEDKINSIVNEIFPADLPAEFRNRFVIDPSWLNKTQKWKDTEKGILEQSEKILSDWKKQTEEIEMIKSLCLDACEGLQSKINPEPFIQRYKYGTSIALLSSEILKEGTQRREAESAVKTKVVEEIIEAKPEPVKPKAQIPAGVNESVMTFTLEISSTQSKLKALRDFMDENGIGYVKV
jgi:hypothetical protein